MRSLVAFAVHRRVTIAMTAIAVAAFGFVGYSRLAVELFPDIGYPSLTVETEFPDTAPQEVENLVTRRVEEAVGVVQGLQQIHSVSRAGRSQVMLEFEWGADMDTLSMEVREKLDRLVLPEEAEDPIALRFDPSLDPIVRLAIHGDGDLTEIRYLAEWKIKQDFEKLVGVAAAQIKGGFEREVQIEVDQERLAALGVPLSRLRDVVGISNVNLPGGALRGEERQYLIRTVNEFETVEEIADLVVWQNEGAFVRLREVATVWMGAKEREEITRVNGQESVEVSIYKEGDANTVTVARALQEKIAEWSGKLPPGLELSVLFNQSHFIEQAVNEVRNAAVVGGVLAILVLLAFLRDLRSTLIIAISIPLSVITTFLVMYRWDISLNIMSLGGLTLGVGMLVDNSIVVLESIFRKRSAGQELRPSAIAGTAEVGAAVVASTLTTVAVFLPIVFVEGIAGQLFKDQALTVTISLIASLVVAVTMIPMLSGIGRQKVCGVQPVTDEDSQTMTLGTFSWLYDRVVRGAVRHRWVTLATALALFVFSVRATERLDTELIPSLSEGEFFFEVNMPEGTSLAGTDTIVNFMEDATSVEAEVERTYATVGSRLVAGGMSLNTTGEYLAQLNLIMRDRADSDGEQRLAERLREKFNNLPDVDVKLGRPSYFSLKTPVEVILFGHDLDELRRLSLELVEKLQGLAGLADIRSSLEAGNPEIQVRFHRQRLAALGLEMDQLSETLRDRIQGVVPTRFKEQDRQIDIRLRNIEENRDSVEDIRNLIIPGPESTGIRLSTVADVRRERGPAEIHRLQQQRAAVVSANLGTASLGAAVAEVERLVFELEDEPGITVEVAGQNREMQVSFQSLQFAIALAIFLVYLVMASTFESFIHPLIVLFTIPLSVVGVVWGLLATSTTISVIVLIGVIMLVGIVVNNAIVLIDTINRFRRSGMEKTEAVIRAGHVRLRPILMTTLTTILGLLPMALAWGEGAELRCPLAITVASGLALSTLLTLVVIPAAYVVVPSRVSGPVVNEASRSKEGTA